MRAVRASLPYRLPLHLVQYLVMDIVSAMNNCVNSKTGGRTPRDLLSGQKLDLDHHYKLAFGDIAIFQKRAGGHRDEDSRGAFGMVIGRDINSKGALRVWYLASREIGMTITYRATELTPCSKHRHHL